MERDFHWTFPDGTVVKFASAVFNVTNIGAGDSTAVAPLEFEVMSNGKPEIILPGQGNKILAGGQYGEESRYHRN